MPATEGDAVDGVAYTQDLSDLGCRFTAAAAQARVGRIRGPQRRRPPRRRARHRIQLRHRASSSSRTSRCLASSGDLLEQAGATVAHHRRPKTTHPERHSGDQRRRRRRPHRIDRALQRGSRVAACDTALPRTTSPSLAANSIVPTPREIYQGVCRGSLARFGPHDRHRTQPHRRHRDGHHPRRTRPRRSSDRCRRPPVRVRTPAVRSCPGRPQRALPNSSWAHALRRPTR